MEKNYAYEFEKAVKERFKEAKKDDYEVCGDTKKNLLKLINNCKNTKKEEYLYKHRYNILNNEIANPKLINIYDKLLKKVLFTDENSVMFTDWNNIFSTIFGNMPVIYANFGVKYVDKIINMLYKTQNEEKIKCLMNLFVSLYHIDKKDIVIIDELLEHINKHESSHILNSFNIIIKNIYKFTDDELLKKYREYIVCQFSESNGKKNSEYLESLLEIFLNNDTKFNNTYLLSLFKTFATSTNMELIYAYYALITNKLFLESNITLQNKCLMLLKKLDNSNFMKIRFTTVIILNIIIPSENKKIQDYLLEKIKNIKNPDSLELLIKLEPVLTTYTNDEEFIRVVDSLEDKDNNITKKLVINLDNE